MKNLYFEFITDVSDMYRPLSCCKNEESKGYQEKIGVAIEYDTIQCYHGKIP